jgi:virginiamycin B lyase
MAIMLIAATAFNARSLALARPGALVLLATVTLTQFRADAQTSSIAGTVRNAGGQPVAGALIEIGSDMPGLAFTAVSQENGRYGFPNLPAGKYQIQAYGGANQSPASPVDMGAVPHPALDLILSSPLLVPAVAKRPTDEDYAKWMPASEPPEIKEITISDCKECHSLQWTVSARKSREKWEESVRRMYHDLLGRRMPLWFALKDDEFVGGKRFSLLMDYLSKNFGPQSPVDTHVLEPWVVPGSAPHPNRNLPRTLLAGPDAKYSSMEFSLPAGSTPDQLAVDSQGIVWVGEGPTGMLGRFDASSLAYTRIAPPSGKGAKSLLTAVAVDAQNQIWIADDGPNARILEYDPKTGTFDSYAIPEYRWPVPDVGPARIASLSIVNGYVWGTRLTAQRILRLDPKSGKILEFPVPRGSSPFGLAVASNEAVWYTAEVGNVVVKLNPTTGELTPHDVPTERSDLRGLSLDDKGNLWAAATESGKLLRIDGTSGKISEYTPPLADSGPYSVDVDTKRNQVWFSENFTDRLARFDAAGKSFVEFSLPSADLDVRHVQIDRTRPGRVWWVGSRSGKIGYIQTVE